jgi:hypothetical protein
MDLIRINEVVESYGVSSRTLRYYEEVGLLWSSHPDNKAQRHYDTFVLLREWANDSNDFQLDAERPEMLEEILPWDIVNKLGKWQQDIFMPIKIIQNGG